MASFRDIIYEIIYVSNWLVSMYGLGLNMRWIMYEIAYSIKNVVL